MFTCVCIGENFENFIEISDVFFRNMKHEEDVTEGWIFRSILMVAQISVILIMLMIESDIDWVLLLAVMAFHLMTREFIFKNLYFLDSHRRETSMCKHSTRDTTF